MRVLVACECSGVVRRAFRDMGHDAWSCDILPAEDGSEFHILGDCLVPAYSGEWDMLLGFPPCTRLSLSGARWCTDHWVKRKNKPDRWHDGAANRLARTEAANFFRQLLEAPVDRIALENPMSMASTLVAKKSQEIQPWQFGHGERKTTWLWLKNLPQLIPTNIVDGREQRVWKMPPGPNRASDRARTFEGIGQAMAMQWGALESADFQPLSRGQYGQPQPYSLKSHEKTHRNDR